MAEAITALVLQAALAGYATDLAQAYQKLDGIWEAQPEKTKELGSSSSSALAGFILVLSGDGSYVYKFCGKTFEGGRYVIRRLERDRCGLTFTPQSAGPARESFSVDYQIGADRLSVAFPDAGDERPGKQERGQGGKGKSVIHVRLR